ncbi:MAG: DUF983 domain-containing protein [Caulobacteraceae bacterium]|nr:DUF983 domain-containing protein [Caulobacter sp.]
MTSTRLASVPAPARPYVAGLAGRCPRCAEGGLFRGFLAVAPTCPACGLDLSAVDPGDGPGVFGMLIGGASACFGLLFTEVALHPPVWVEALVWLPVAALLSVGLLRPFKGALIAAQYANHAAEHRADD